MTPASLTPDLLQALKSQRIETPSWGYGNSGTRFKTFAAPGAARDIWEKLDDAAEVQRLTGIAPGVALHIPWDEVEDYGELKKYAAQRGLSIGAVNPNVFQDEAYQLGSVTNPDEAVREQAIAHLLDCVEVMRQTGSRDLSLWFADGTNYAGQDDLRSRKHRMRAGPQARSRRHARRHADAGRVQVVRTGLLRHRPVRLGRGVFALPGHR